MYIILTHLIIVILNGTIYNHKLNNTQKFIKKMGGKIDFRMK
jgi:hypothetical protein